MKLLPHDTRNESADIISILLQRVALLEFYNINHSFIYLFQTTEVHRHT